MNQQITQGPPVTAVGDRVRAERFSVSHPGQPGEDGLIRDAQGAVVTIDDNVTVPPGTLGTVMYIDDAGSPKVDWDNGARLGLIPGADHWEIVSQ